MMHHAYLEHRFIKQLPDRLEGGVLYISMEYATSAHLCCCGCGEEVVTPFTPTDWKMIFDGETITLSPSIGNWNFACRSHYFIDHGRIIEATSWTDEKVEANRNKDKVTKADYYSIPKPIALTKPNPEVQNQVKEFRKSPSFIKVCLDATEKVWRDLLNFLSR
jgi:Family of unknown function (DUF6527)